MVATTELITSLSNFIPIVSLHVIYAAIIQVYLKLRSSSKKKKIHARIQKSSVCCRMVEHRNRIIFMRLNLNRPTYVLDADTKKYYTQMH